MSDHRRVLRGLLLLLSAAGSIMGRRIAASSLSIKLLPPPSRIHPFIRMSEAHYDHTHHTHHHHKEVPEPHFSSTNASREVFLGDTATLDCTVHDLLNESVSWMRQVDEVLELLTWDTHTYVKDERYRLVHEEGEGWQKWQLVIGNVQAQDVGEYRCQVDTTPPLVLDAALTVTEPRTRVVDERGDLVEEKHYNSGSMIELKCVVERVPFPPGPVTWRRGDTVLHFNTSRGGISVKGDEASGFISSRLYVANASPADSGPYSCWYRNYTTDTVTVHVIAGENSQAMQHDAPPDATATATPVSPFSPLIALLTWIASPPHLGLGR